MITIAYAQEINDIPAIYQTAEPTKEMKTPIISTFSNTHVSIAIQIHESGVHSFAILTYKNITNNLIYIFKGAPLVRVIDSTGKEVDYQGIMYSRAPLTINDYTKLAPGSSIEKRYELGKLHKFKESGRFTLTHPGGYYDPSKDIDYPAPPIYVEFEMKK
jgi:hypothetical protein